MRQPQPEGMYIDSDDDRSSDESPRGEKRSRPEAGEAPELHGEPGFKRPRTEAPGQPGQAPDAHAGLAPVPPDFPHLPVVPPGFSSGDSSSLPRRHDWRTTITRSLTTAELDSLVNHDVPRALFLLCGAELAHCPAEQFFIEAIPGLSPVFRSMLLDLGRGDHDPAGRGFPVVEACKGDAFDTAELLLKRGADPNWLDWNGHTPLMCAA